MTIGYQRIINSYGEPIQQSLTVDPTDMLATRYNRLVLGVVMHVNASDSESNRSAYQREDRRGYLHTCTVQVVGGTDSSYYVLDNVIITPDARSGIDDYCERLPRGSSGLVTGEAWTTEMNSTNPYDLDGDWCIVGFLGGNLDAPFIVRWWPHPRGLDAATSGTSNPNVPGSPPYLDQAGRHFQRINGVEFTVTRRGDIYVSTHHANSTMQLGPNTAPVAGRFPRITDAENGGAFKAWIKSSQSFELDWNAPVDGIGILDVPDDSIVQSNPAAPASPAQKEDTYLLIDSTRMQVEVPVKFEVISKQQVLLTSQEETTLTVGTDLTANVSGTTAINTGGDLAQTVTGQTTLLGTGPMTISGQTTLDLVSQGATSITGAAVAISGSTVAIGTAPGASGTPGAINADALGVTLGTGALGGVVGGTPFSAAFATFAAAMAAAQPMAAISASSYAAAVTVAVSVLVSSLSAAVSVTTKVG